MIIELKYIIVCIIYIFFINKVLDWIASILALCLECVGDVTFYFFSFFGVFILNLKKKLKIKMK